MEECHRKSGEDSKRTNQIRMNEVFFMLEKDNACQSKYFYGIVDVLNRFLSDYSIIMTADYKTLPDTSYKKIVLLACEDGQKGIMPYKNRNDVVAVFRFYAQEWGYDNKYVFPIPIGYNCRTDGHFMEGMYPEKKISERKYDIFYSGQYLPSRKELVNRLGELKTSFNVFVQANGAFRTGLPIGEYYRYLGNSKICVAPAGTSEDTFRFNEAIGSGCVVITTKKPPFWYYYDAPVFFLNSWKELTKEFISNILSRDLDSLQKDIKEYYTDCLSEEAVANYIIKTIRCMK